MSDTTAEPGLEATGALYLLFMAAFGTAVEGAAWSAPLWAFLAGYALMIWGPTPRLQAAGVGVNGVAAWGVVA